MKTKTTISEITHEDLVNLFSTALYSSNYLGANYDKHPDLEDCECFEDKLAKSLLNGRSIRFIDYCANGEVHGNLPHEIVEDDSFMSLGDNVTYFITLDEVKRGLENCANGTFNTRTDVSEDFAMRNAIFAKKSFNAFLMEDLDFDYYTADCLMQVILFDEIVYG